MADRSEQGIAHDVRWHMDPAEAGMDRATLLRGPALLEQGCLEGRHAGAQVYISRHSRPVVEYACGEAAPGVPMTADAIPPWFSASKPVVALAIALLYERGALDLENRVTDYLPQFRNGKETCTLRHVLTHQGGFAGALSNGDAPSWNGDALSWEDTIAAICSHPAEYAPGSKAGYHSTSGWYILAEILRRVDGRSVERFVADEIFAPLGIVDSHMGIPAADQAALDGRLARVGLGKTDRPHFADRTFVERFNGAEEIARVNPSGGIRGPARELGRIYDWLLAGGQWRQRRVLERRTVALFTACHRWGLPDTTLMGAPLAWGLGFALYGNTDVHRAYSRRVFNHSGMVSSVALGDPESGLAVVAITTGLLDPLTNARRLREITGTALAACRKGEG